MNMKKLFTQLLFATVFVFSAMPYAKGESGDLLLTITNPSFYEEYGFGSSIVTTPEGDIVVGLTRNDVNGIEDTGSVAIIDTTTGEILRIINNPDPKRSDLFGINVEIMPNGNLLVAERGQIGDPKVHLFDVSTGALLLSIGHDIQVVTDYSMAGTPEGNIVLGSPSAPGEGAVFIYDGTSGQLLLEINNPAPEVDGRFGWAVASTADGNLLISTGSPDYENANNQVYLYDDNTGDLLQSISRPGISDYWLGGALAVTSEGNYVIQGLNSDSFSRYIHIIDDTTGVNLETIGNPDPFPTFYTSFGEDIAVTPNGNILASTGSTFVTGFLGHLFDGTTGELLHTIEDPNSIIAPGNPKVETTPDGKIIVSVPYDGTPDSPNFDYYGEIYVFEGLSQSCSLVGSTLEDISCIIDKLQSISDANQGTPLEVKVDAAILDLQTSLEKLNKTPPNYKSALRFLRLAVKDMDAAVAEGLLDADEGTRLMDSMTSIAKKVAQDAIDRASDRGGDPNKIKGAMQLILIGDQRRTVGRYINALWQYRKALIMAEEA